MRLYSTKETAEILKVSIRTLKYWRKEGKLVPEVRGAKGAKFYSEVQILEVQKLLKSANSRGAKFTPQIQECKNIEVQSTLKNEKTLETRESGENETREFVTPQIQECKILRCKGCKKWKVSGVQKVKTSGRKIWKKIMSQV